MKCPTCGGGVASIEGRGVVRLDNLNPTNEYAHAYHCVNGHSWPAQSKPFIAAIMELGVEI